MRFSFRSTFFFLLFLPKFCRKNKVEYPSSKENSTKLSKKTFSIRSHVLYTYSRRKRGNWSYVTRKTLISLAAFKRFLDIHIHLYIPESISIFIKLRPVKALISRERDRKRNKERIFPLNFQTVEIELWPIFLTRYIFYIRNSFKENSETTRHESWSVDLTFSFLFRKEGRKEGRDAKVNWQRLEKGERDSPVRGINLSGGEEES